MEVYKKKEIMTPTTPPTIQLLVRDSEAADIAYDWVRRGIECDLRRAKTPKHVVIETSDPLFARHVQIWHPKAKVNIINK